VAAKDGYKEWMKLSFADGKKHDMVTQGNVVEVIALQGHNCLRVTSGKYGCLTWRVVGADAEGQRVRIRYFAHKCKGLEVLFSEAGGGRHLAKAANFVNDKWAEAEVIPKLAGATGKINHAEYTGVSSAADAYLLLDEIVWEKK